MRGRRVGLFPDLLLDIDQLLRLALLDLARITAATVRPLLMPVRSPLGAFHIGVARFRHRIVGPGHLFTRHRLGSGSWRNGSPRRCRRILRLCDGCGRD